MRKLLLALILTALVGASGWMLLRLALPASAIRIDIEGAEGLGVDGECRTDRETVRLNGVIPTGMMTRGNRATFRIQKKRSEGQMTVTVFIDGRRHGAATAAGRYRTIDGEIANGNATIQAR